MSPRFRVPVFKNPNIVIRLVNDTDELEQANLLVYRNYVNLYWPDDLQAFRCNPYLRSPARHAFVAVDHRGIVGTMSIIVDTPNGLPSNSFEPRLLDAFRDRGERLAEITSFAIDQNVPHSMSLTMYLIKFLFLYTFNYTDVDRFIASCRPKHADFYEARLGFTKLTPPTPYAYAGNVACQLVSLALRDLESLNGGELQRFLLVDDHPCVQLPLTDRVRRMGPPRRSAAAAAK
jgi:hypothetical protein